MAQRHDAWLRLHLAPGLGPALMGRCVETLGSPEAVLGASVAGLAAVHGLGHKRATQLRVDLDGIDAGALEREKARMSEVGARALTIDDGDYPALLRHIADPPPVLCARGDLQPDDAIALAVVGARRCSHYGREQADRLASLCAQSGLCIVSGGAYGIDAAAHGAALRGDGRTIAVLGSGVGNPYPPPHRALFDRIADGRGAVLSELPVDYPPLAENFPRRNRLISGLALGVLVVEAAQRSGALITARLAAEDHGREVMAVPGRVDQVTSAGCHKMIREGWATLVTGPADILDALGETGQLLKAGLRQEGPAEGASTEQVGRANLTDTQQRVVAALNEPRALDELAAATGLPVSGLQADLTVLEIRGVLERAGGRFALRR